MAVPSTTSKSTQDGLARYHKRYALLMVPIVIAFIILIGRFWYLQVLLGEEFHRASTENIIRAVEIKPSRGRIFDAHGVVLADNRASFDVSINSRIFKRHYVMDTMKSLSVYLLLDMAEVDRIKSDIARGLSTVVVQRDLTRAQMALLKARSFDLPGVYLKGSSALIKTRTFKKHWRPGMASTMHELGSYLSLSESEMARIKKRVKYGHAKVLVRRDITRAQVALIEAHRLDLPGVEVHANAHRHYPLHEVGAHTLGFLGKLGSRELESKEELGYRSGDYIGRMGLERAYEPILRGSPGLERDVVDARGNPQGEAETKFLIGEYQHVRPVAGRDMVTTLDSELMLIIDHAMRHRASGSVVALDPRDGSVRALYSKPSFNPNSWTGRLSSQEKLRHDNDPYKPMLDKSVNSYFPGSVYKIVGSLAALEEGLLGVADEVYCNGSYRYGRKFRCWKRSGHKHTTVVSALAESCDVYFYKVAQDIGINKIAEHSYRFGFGEVTGIGINNESPGRVPTKEWYEKNDPRGYTGGYALGTIIGQGDVLTSPLQIALAYAAIANEGTLFYPKLIQEVRARDGKVLFEFSTRKRKDISFKAEELAAIKLGLWGTVNTENGTAYKTRLEDVEVSGKTGTAQIHKIGRVRISNKDKEVRFRDHAWFASYAPSDDPKLVLVVFLQHGGHGGSDAAPVAMEIYDRYFKRDRSRPLTSRIIELSKPQLKDPPELQLPWIQHKPLDMGVDGGVAHEEGFDEE